MYLCIVLFSLHSPFQIEYHFFTRKNHFPLFLCTFANKNIYFEPFFFVFERRNKLISNILCLFTLFIYFYFIILKVLMLLLFLYFIYIKSCSEALVCHALLIQGLPCSIYGCIGIMRFIIHNFFVYKSLPLFDGMFSLIDAMIIWFGCRCIDLFSIIPNIYITM